MEVITGSRSLRPVILMALVVCIWVAALPWKSGGQEPVAMLVSGAALLLGMLLVWRQPEVRGLRRGPLMWSFVGLLGIAALSLLWTANRYSTALWIAEWLLAGLAFALAYIVAGEPQGRRWILRGYLVSAVGFCAVAVWMYLTSEYGRLTGTFYWANPAAAYLMPAILLAVDGMRKQAGKAYKWVALGGWLVGSFLLTDSRATTAVLVLVTILYLLVVPTSRAFWIKFVFTMVMGFALSLGLAKLSTLTVQHSTKVLPGSRFAEAARGEAKSLPDRVYYLQSAFEMWFDHPLRGTGAGTYGDVHPQYQQRVVSASTSAHNLYVQTLAELGIAGAVMLAAVLLWLMVGALRGLTQEGGLTVVALGTLGLLMHFGLDIDARYPALLLLAAILFGVMYRQWGEGRRGLSGWSPALAALLLVPLVSLYQSGVWSDRGKAAQEDGEYATAVEHYAKAHTGIVYNPDLISAEGINWYGMAVDGGAEAKTATAMALDRAHQAERQDPRDGQHWQLEGRVLALRGDLAGAQAALRTALEFDPYNHPDYALDLASFQVRAGDVSGGVATAQKMLALYPQAVVDNRNFDETLRPTLANLETLIGNVALQNGKTDEAGAAVTRALRYDPKSLRGRALQHQVEELKSRSTSQ